MEQIVLPALEMMFQEAVNYNPDGRDGRPIRLVIPTAV